MVSNRRCLDTRDVRENLLGDRGEDDLLCVYDLRGTDGDDDVDDGDDDVEKREEMESLMLWLRLRRRPRRVS